MSVSLSIIFRLIHSLREKAAKIEEQVSPQFQQVDAWFDDVGFDQDIAIFMEMFGSALYVRER